MTAIDYLAALRDDGTALAAAAGQGLDAPVPACDGWTVADLILHTGMVHRHKLAIVRGRLAELLEALGDTDPATPVWTFHRPDQTAGFWRRRMAQETVVHRVDAESAHGRPGPVPAALAADGVNEALEVFLAPYLEGRPAGGNGESLRLETADTGDRWQVRLLPTGIEVGPGQATADASAAGGAADLLLWLWGRGPADPLDRTGDPALVPRVRELAAEATQ
jgi:uncharacterized protein (TIGR03083 family)